MQNMQQSVCHLQTSEMGLRSHSWGWGVLGEAGWSLGLSPSFSFNNLPKTGEVRQQKQTLKDEGQTQTSKEIPVELDKATMTHINHICNFNICSAVTINVFIPSPISIYYKALAEGLIHIICLLVSAQQ